MNTRSALQVAAERNGWTSVVNQDQRVDIYREVPYSVMIEFSRDGMIVNARLFTDPPDERLQLPPRIVKSVDKFDDNKRRRVSAWFYHYKSAA